MHDGHRKEPHRADHRDGPLADVEAVGGLRGSESIDTDGPRRARDPESPEDDASPRPTQLNPRP